MRKEKKRGTENTYNAKNRRSRRRRKRVQKQGLSHEKGRPILLLIIDRYSLYDFFLLVESRIIVISTDTAAFFLYVK